MSEPTNPFDLLLDQIRQVVREELQRARISTGELLEPEELAARLKVPVSWVYEQSRTDQIPTYRVGRYIRFDLAAVLDSPAYRKKIENGAANRRSFLKKSPQPS